MPSKFLGFPYPITKDARGYFHTQSDVEQIKDDLLVLLLTNPGERCLTGDTLIPLANGAEAPIADLVGKEDFWVYSYDAETNAIVAGKATAHKTILNSELLEITLDNNEKVRCTPNHLWLLRDGTYKRADELCMGESLMPLYRTLNTSGYERVYQPYLGDYRETHLCFVFEKRLSGIREVVHHRDLNKRNNSPDNLQWMTRHGHVQLHKEISNAFMIKFNNDPEFRKSWEAKQKKGLLEHYKTHPGKRKGAKLSEETRKKLSDNKKQFYETEKGIKLKEHLRELAVKQFENGSPLRGKKLSDDEKAKLRGPRPSISGENNPSKRPEVREKLRLAWQNRRMKNHKVKSVVKLTKREDCYDLNVDRYHNFGLSCGVFVHNCMLPNFGTGLRDLIFEPNDSALHARARDMIIDAIRTWEPRISVDQVEVSADVDETSLNLGDDGTERAAILMIRIKFLDPANIKSVQELVLQVPLGGVA